LPKPCWPARPNNLPPVWKRRAKRRAAVILDEFQHVIEEGGATAERQIRGTVQRHHDTAYVFAGSKTRLLAESSTAIFIRPVKVNFAP